MSASTWTPKKNLKGKQSKQWVIKGKVDEPTADHEDEELLLQHFKDVWETPADEDNVSSKDYYFNSYAQFGIHEDMLKDQARTGSYSRAIMAAADQFKDKVVLDVGSGTGILSLFAAKAGAKLVIGVECSDIADYATRIAAANNLGDRVTFVKGKVEEVELPVDKVDIIISEWMGYFLIYESMLDSVLAARDKWLVPGGSLFPDRARLYIAAMEDAEYKEEKIGFWDHVWGFTFAPMRQMVLQEPISDAVDLSAIATSTCHAHTLDLQTVKKADLDFEVPFLLQVRRQDFLHALVVWFDVEFSSPESPVVLTTAPGRPNTHWKQSVLYFTEPLVTFNGDVVRGILAVRKNLKNARDIDIKMVYKLDGQMPSGPTTQYFRLR